MNTSHCFLWLLFDYLSQCECDLKLLQTLFRHGDRVRDGVTTLGFDLYPNDPHPLSIWYPVSEGGLTNVGKQRSFKLGVFYQRRYGSWLGSNSSAVKFISSTSNRTKITAHLVAAGLFSPDNSQGWNVDDLNRQPVIAISSNADVSNYLFYNSALCSNYEDAMTRALQREPELIAYFNESKDFYEFLSMHTGYNGTRRVANLLYLTLMSERDMGLELPEWTRDIFPEGKLKKAAIMEYAVKSFNDELKRLTGGIWLTTWFNNIDDFIHAGQIPGLKAYFYSGHDVNLSGLLSTLGIFKPHIPAFNSAIMFELHEDNQKFFVQVLYRQSDNSTNAYVIPGCKEVLCPLDFLRRHVEKILPKDPERECGKIVNFK